MGIRQQNVQAIRKAREEVFRVGKSDAPLKAKLRAHAVHQRALNNATSDEQSEALRK